MNIIFAFIVIVLGVSELGQNGIRSLINGYNPYMVAMPLEIKAGYDKCIAYQLNNLTFMDWLKLLIDFNYEALFFLIISIIAIAQAFALVKRRKRLLRSGVTSVGEVVGFRYGVSNRIFSKSPVIRFVTDEGEIIESEHTVRADFTSYKKGMKVAIMYDPKAPRIFLIKDDDDSNVVSIILLVAGLAMLFLALRMFINL